MGHRVSIVTVWFTGLLVGCGGVAADDPEGLSPVDRAEIPSITGDAQGARGEGRGLEGDTLAPSDASGPAAPRGETPWAPEDTNQGEPDALPGASEDAEADAGPAPLNCPGSFGCPCEDPSECFSGYCLEGADGELACTKVCEDTCPEGYLCAQVPGSSDVTFVCVVLDDQLCQPCASDEVCGNMGGVCLGVAEGAGRCGRGCLSDLDCPEGFGCQEAGVGAMQCVPSDGECPCIAETLGIVRACATEGALGTCLGEERC